MKEPKLGKIIPKNDKVERDAIHIAVVPMIAGERLSRGAKFKLAYGRPNIALDGSYNSKKEVVGIVDPFLDDWEVKEGQQFWGFLLPGTVTGMRHHWEHPAFDRPPQFENEHEEWLRKFCDEWNFSFSQLIEAATGTGDWRYVTAQGIDLHSAEELGGDLALFWEHLEGYTGKTFDQAHRDGMGWSCSC